MGHDSFQPTNREEPTTSIDPKKIGEGESAESVRMEIAVVLSALNIGSHEDISGIEFGGESTTIGGAADQTLSTQNNDSNSVTFATAFPTTPQVVVGHEGGRRTTARVLNPSTTGVTIAATNYNTTQQTIVVSWVAIA